MAEASSTPEPELSPEIVAGSSTAVMVIFEVAAEDELVPSLTSHEMVRFAVLGLSEMLL